MSVIFDCGVLKPTAARYADEKFRRYARWFRPRRMAPDQLGELVAFVEMVGLPAATAAFQWYDAGPKAYARVKRKYAHLDWVQRMVEANHQGWTMEDGLLLLSAMKDGGWTRGIPPKIVGLALDQLHASGLPWRRVAQEVGYTKYQVRLWARGPRPAVLRSRRDRAWAKALVFAA